MTIDWSTWEPGDTDAEFIASTPGWLAEGLRNQKISFPGADKVELDEVAKIVALGLGSGSAESKTVKEVVSQLSIDKELAKSLTHFAMALAMCQRALGEYEYAKGAKIQWDSAGCCDKCDKNDGEVIEAGKTFQSGHQFPPACDYCICDIMPFMEFQNSPTIAGLPLSAISFQQFTISLQGE